MTQDITVLQSEIVTLKQQNEILQLKHDLQMMQAQKASRLEDSLFAPSLYEHYFKIATMLAKSGVIPKCYIGKPDDIFVAMAMGYQLGLPVEQSLQDIAVINGKPCIYGDGLLAVVISRPDCVSIHETPIMKGDLIIGYSCTVERRGHAPHTKQFTLQDAENAGLFRNPTWKSYPDRMLQMRARSFAIRDKFADALRGIAVAEEVQDYNIIDGEIVEAPQTQTEKTKNQIKDKVKNKTPSDTFEIPVTAVDKPIHNTGRDDIEITPDQIDYIYGLIKEKEMPPERLTAAMAYFKVDSVESMSDAQARLFILQLGKL